MTAPAGALAADVHFLVRVAGQFGERRKARCEFLFGDLIKPALKRRYAQCLIFRMAAQHDGILPSAKTNGLGTVIA